MVEYHVDTCDLFQQRMNEETAFGGEKKRPIRKRANANHLGAGRSNHEAIPTYQ
jgi:hypothetical protein